MRLSLSLLLVLGGLPGQPFQTHGHAVGDPRPDGASVWARASGPALVSVMYDTDPAFGSPQETSPVAVDGSTDFTSRIDLVGLSAGTTWHYRVRLTDPASPGFSTLSGPGTFRTAPLPTTPADLTIAFTADVRDTQYYGLFDAMAATSPDLVLLLGDMPYADAAPAATTLAAYRQKHREVRDHPSLLGLLASTAIAATWDDHEVRNNWDATTDPNLVALGRAVWMEYFPTIPTGGEIYRSLRMGSAAEIFMLDTRTHRGENAARDVPGRTMLGAAQLQWLLAGLDASDATFKIVATSVPLRYGTTNKDHWDGYMFERQAILDWIAQRRIDNVLFLSGDQHWSAIHHHKEGVKEFQGCPLATSTRSRGPPEPEVVGRWVTQSFGVLRLRPGLVPAEAEIEIHDATGIVSTSVVRAGIAGRVTTSVDDPRGRVVLDGAHRFDERGPGQARPYAPPGTYAVTFVPPSPVWPAPDGQTVTVPDGGFLSTAAGFGVPDDPGHPELLSWTFESDDLSSWTVVDQGTVSAPSSWFVDGDQLVQSSNVYGGATTSDPVDKPGTRIETGSPAWSDYVLSFRVTTHDDDGIGALVRLDGSGAGYRFAMDRQRGFAALTRVGAAPALLASVPFTYEKDTWYEVVIKAIGPELSVLVNGIPLLSASDAAVAQGRVALYCWGSQVVRFDDVRVVGGDAPLGASGGVFDAHFGTPGLAGWTVVDQVPGASSAWAVAGGEVVQTSNIAGGSSSGAVAHKPGTFLRAGDPAWTDVRASVRLRNGDDDAIGVMFRVADPDNYYRFSMDRQRSYRRLTRTTNGITVALAEDAVAYDLDRWYEVVVRAEGTELEVLVDGASILAATDAAHPAGDVALYCWGSDDAHFDDVVVTSGPAPPSLAAHGTGAAFDIDLFASSWPGRSYLVALSSATGPGIPLAGLDPTDPRIIPLAPGPLLLASLVPGPPFSGFAGALDGGGRGTASVTLPTPASGITVYASAIVLEPTALSGVAAVLPAVEIALP